MIMCHSYSSVSLKDLALLMHIKSHLKEKYQIGDGYYGNVVEEFSATLAKGLLCDVIFYINWSKRSVLFGCQFTS